MTTDYNRKRSIEGDVFHFIMDSICDSIYESWLKNETYTYNKDVHLELLYRYADDRNRITKRSYPNYYGGYNQPVLKVSDVGVGADKDESAHLFCADGYSDYARWVEDYERTSYIKMAFRITEAIKKYTETCYAKYQQNIASYGRNFTPTTEIEALEYEKYMRESGYANAHPTKNSQQSKVNKFSSTFELMVDYLQRCGIQCNVDEDNLILFNYNELNFECYTVDYENGFSQIVIVLPDVFAIGNDESSDLKMLNELNLELDVKFVVDPNKSIMIMVSTWVDSTPELDYLVPALIHNLVDAYEEFNKRTKK